MSAKRAARPDSAKIIPMALLADLTSYVQAQERLGELYSDSGAWAWKAILVASFGKFSSDRTVGEYANDIWKVNPCPIP